MVKDKREVFYPFLPKAHAALSIFCPIMKEYEGYEGKMGHFWPFFQKCIQPLSISHFL